MIKTQQSKSLSPKKEVNQIQFKKRFNIMTDGFRSYSVTKTH